ncbi:MAG: ABC transporter substrate-binding protein, partial [Candidatus Nanopelagicales bacterium]
MNRRLAVGASALAVAGLVLAGCAGGSSEETAAEETTAEETTAEAAGEEAATEETAEPENPIVCTAAFGVMAPLTGGAASIGQEQLNFAKLAVADFNAANPSADYSLVESDTQLDAGQASTQATALIADGGIVGVVGPAGSQEVAAVGPAFAEASMAFVSPSATNPDLTNGDNPTFYRVVPTDAVQGPTDAAFMVDELGADSVVVIQ